MLALDGGNSKTDVALVAADGTLLGRGRAPGSRTFPTPETLTSIGAAVQAVAHGAGLPGGWPVAAHTVACMANADLPEEEERLAGLLAAEGWSHRTEVANDTFAVLRAGLDRPDGHVWGVAVTCGAGINCVGVSPDGRATGYLALGWISGDWGGGLGLGREALWWAVRAEDGRGPQTALRELVTTHFRVPEARDVTIGIHLGTISPDELQELVPGLLAAARDGDQVAADLVGRLAGEVVTMAATVIRRLGLDGLDQVVPVVLGGGLLTAGDALLDAQITDRLTVAAPQAVARVVDVPPIAGAALLGLDQAGGGPAAEARLRAAFGPAASPLSRTSRS